MSVCVCKKEREGERGREKIERDRGARRERRGEES